MCAVLDGDCTHDSTSIGMDMVEGKAIDSAFNSLSSFFNIHPIESTQVLGVKTQFVHNVLALFLKTDF